ncbi:MAG: Fe-S cluster assembly protein SufD, partial [Bacillota bacterium]|nr:Fe-S cluster assembly protein SufD [Bacillota bacterium]
TGAVQKETLVKKYLAQLIAPGEDKFTALSAALWSGGFFLHVPAGVELTLPLQTLRFRSSKGVSISRTLVILERGAHVTLVESQHGADDPEEGLDVHGVELVVGPGASLRYVDLQNWDEKTWSFIQRRSLLLNDASMIWALGEFGGRVARSSFVSEHRGNGSRSRSYTVFFSSGRQHHDLFQTMYHTGHHTDANMDARGAVAGQSRCVYRGDIEIERGTRDTSSFESMNGLVLDPGARIDSIPSLYIEDNDVRASHSATTGQVDQEQLFYLMSRGISYQEARRLIVQGFFSPILGEIPLESAREAFERLIARKLGGA